MTCLTLNRFLERTISGVNWCGTLLISKWDVLKKGLNWISNDSIRFESAMGITQVRGRMQAVFQLGDQVSDSIDGLIFKQGPYFISHAQCALHADRIHRSKESGGTAMRDPLASKRKHASLAFEGVAGERDNRPAGGKWSHFLYVRPPDSVIGGESARPGVAHVPGQPRAGCQAFTQFVTGDIVRKPGFHCAGIGTSQPLGNPLTAC